MNVYGVSTQVRMTNAIVSYTGAPIDAAVIALSLRSPDGIATDLSASIIHDGTGLYHADYLPTEVGVYLYFWVASGSVEVSGQGKFQVTGPTASGSGV